MMSFRVSHCISCLFFALFLLSGCGGTTPTATPQPAATPVPATATPVAPTATAAPPTATPQPAATPTQEVANVPLPDLTLPADWVTFTDEAQGLEMHHPAAWDVTQPTADKLNALFAQAGVGAASESLQAILGQLRATPGALDLFAALGFLFDDPTVADNQFISNFTAIVVPAEGLTLDTYTKLVGMQLGGMEAMALQSAQVVSGLRPGGLDVASLRYAIDGAYLYGLPGGTQIDGWQVALYDTDANRLLVLSLTGASENFPALEEMFATLIYHLEFE